MPNSRSSPHLASGARDVTPELLAAAKDVYADLLRKRGEIPTLSDVVGRLGGAYPTAVVKALRELELRYAMPPSVASRHEYDVELHALDFEWYFSADTIRLLAGQLPPSANVLFIGTPTIAAARARQGIFIRLIDSNPLVRRRFPDLDLSNTHIARIEDVRRTFDEPDSIVLDAPWNFRDVMTWLRIAHAHAKPGTTILSSLFPERTRPTARGERARVLQLAAQIGDVSVTPDALRYETPLYEQEVLRAQGVTGLSDWRNGDLVTIRVRAYESIRQRSARILSTGAPRRRDPWDRFVIGKQVVKLRQRRTSTSGPLIQPVPGCPDNLLPSVSARDPRRKSVGLWTSRNRVAAVRSPRRVALVLRELERGRNLYQALEIAAAKGRALDASSAHVLSEVLALDRAL